MSSARTAIAAGLLVAGLAGCGADVSIGAAPTSSALSTAPSTTVAPTTTGGGVSSGAITRPPSSGSGSAGVLPAGFPLPPGTTVGPVAVQGGEIAATLSVPDGKQVFDYWKQQLPAAGYTVDDAEMVGGIGQISFSGNGCAHGSRLGISGPTVAFRCARA
ncbi:MAG TPA: hypothetical protein VI357_13485 [Mycobacteriales bacterium]